MATEKIIEIVFAGLSTYGPGFIIIILLLLLLIIICNKTKLIDWITDKVDARREFKHQRGLEERDKKTTMINERLAQLLLDTSSDRAVLFEYHNNGSNFSGLPFIHVSAHAEAAAPCLSPVSQKFQNMPVACFSKTIEEINHKGLVIINDIQKQCDSQPLLCEYFNTFNAKQLFITPINGISHQLGFIVIARNHHRDVTDTNRTDIELATQAISSILDVENVKDYLKK